MTSLYDLTTFLICRSFLFFWDLPLSKVLASPIPIYFNNIFLFQVNHSQKLNEKPLTPWVFAHKDGVIISAHCDCMAGLGETCSHVGALLWAVESATQHKNNLTVTDKVCYWNMPTSIKKVLPCQVRNMKFNNNLDIQTKEPQAQSSSSSSDITQLNDFVKQLAEKAPNAAILSVLPEYCQNFVPVSMSSSLPPILSIFFDKNNLNKEKNEISVDMKSLLQINEEQQAAAFNATVEDRNKVWHNLRAGRITASVMKNACSTNVQNPSLSLIKKICYPNITSVAFTSKYTAHGIKNEPKALTEAFEELKKIHSNPILKKSGIFISLKHSFLSCTPDGLFSCDCCEDATIEVKVPYYFTMLKCGTVSNVIVIYSYFLNSLFEYFLKLFFFYSALIHIGTVHWKRACWTKPFV
ncbi:UNVERIFIED_CONTAM: hypothetical protein GTU68_057373 [Idotea baltica]|nr:hypothetical protein [Idotea baltica]